MTRVRWRGVAALVGALLPGCPDAAAPPDATLSDAVTADDVLADPTLDLGTGRLAFEPVDPLDGRVPLIHGPQGGYHLFARLRWADLGPDVAITFAVTPLAGGAPINDPAYSVHRLEGRGLVRTATGWASSDAEFCFLTGVHAPGAVLGRRFRWQVFVRPTGAARAATAERLITIVPEVP